MQSDEAREVVVIAAEWGLETPLRLAEEAIGPEELDLPGQLVDRLIQWSIESARNRASQGGAGFASQFDVVSHIAAGRDLAQSLAAELGPHFRVLLRIFDSTERPDEFFASDARPRSGRPAELARALLEQFERNAEREPSADSAANVEVLFPPSGNLADET